MTMPEAELAEAEEVARKFTAYAARVELNPEPSSLLLARALLSTSSALRGMREALELVRMSNGWRYMAPETKNVIDHALSSKGEDEQARGQGRSAPTSTDTKDTSK